MELNGIHPLALLGRFLDRRQHALVFQTVLKRRVHRLALDAGVHEIRDGVDERVLVADAVARRPPMADVRLDVVALRHLDFAETAPVRRVVAVVKFQLVHVLEIEIQSSLCCR
jgi:hypothetical protein